MGYKVKLTELQRERLIEVVRNGKQQAKVIMHANVLLQADCSANGPALNAKVIAENLSIHNRTVHRIRRKYAEEGIEAAIQRKPHKQYKPRRLDGEAEAHLIALCCGQAPESIRSRAGPGSGLDMCHFKIVTCQDLTLIYGALIKDASIPKEAIGKINILPFKSYVAIHKDHAKTVDQFFQKGKLKGRYVNIYFPWP